MCEAAEGLPSRGCRHEKGEQSIGLSRMQANSQELLVATRHILTPDSRSAFVPYIDVLLEEKLLVGTGITCREVLR